MEGEKELGQEPSSRWEHTQVLPYDRFFGELGVMSFVTTPKFNDGGCKVRGGWLENAWEAADQVICGVFSRSYY